MVNRGGTGVVSTCIVVYMTDRLTLSFLHLKLLEKSRGKGGARMFTQAIFGGVHHCGEIQMLCRACNSPP